MVNVDVNVDGLTSKLQQLQEQLTKASYERDEYKKLYELVLLELERTRRHLFGKKAETVDSAQVQLAFADIAKALKAVDELEGKVDDESANKRAKRKARPHGRQQLPEHLPVERIELPTPPQVKAESDAYEYIGDDVSERLEWRTGSFVRVQIVRPKYSKKGAPEQGVVAAELPPMPIDKGMAGPGLLANVLVSKFGDSLPLNRQSKIYKRQGVELSRSTLCGWVEQSDRLCRPVVEAMWEDALTESNYVAIDATGVLVWQPERCRRGHFWVLISENEHVLFRYSAKHNKAAVHNLLRDYKGYVHADAATVFDFLYNKRGCTEVGCWAHSRRRFFDAISTDRDRALKAIGFIRTLYKIDRDTKDFPRKKRTLMRRKRAGPVVEEFFSWCDSEHLVVLPESPIGQAIGYARNQKDALCRFLEDGRLRLDNNWSERELRREAVGRRNWTFAGSDDGARWNTTFMSLIASCELHGIEPWAYLRDVLCLLPVWSDDQMLELAPKYWRTTIEKAEAQQLLNDNPVRRVSTQP